MDRYGPDVTAEKIDPRYLRMPHAERGMVVGLFGRSFNPPHKGHALVAEIAIRRLGLDQLWWMVTPGNPLKSRNHLAPLSERLSLSEGVALDPRIKVTAFEQALGLNYTADTLARIKAMNRNVHFIWIMGADSLNTFHKWQKWRNIARTFRSRSSTGQARRSYLSAKMAKTFHYARVDEDDARVLWKKPAPAWAIHGPRSALS